MYISFLLVAFLPALVWLATSKVVAPGSFGAAKGHTTRAVSGKDCKSGVKKGSCQAYFFFT